VTTPQHPAVSTILIALAGHQTLVLADMLIKLGGTMPPWQTGFLSSLIALPLLLLLTWWRGGLHVLRTRRPMLHLQRSICFVLVFFGVAMALPRIALTDYIVIVLSGPFMLTVLGILFLGERPSFKVWVALIAGFAGVLLAVKFGIEKTDQSTWLGIGAAFFAIFFYSVGNFLTRRGAKTEHVLAIMFYPNVLNFLICGGLCLVQWDGLVTDVTANGYLLANGVVRTAGQLLVALALLRAPTYVMSGLHYTQLVGAILLGWLVWNHIPAVATWGGIAIIVLAGMYFVHHQRKQTLPSI
jgi:drug/metabolite transporter (DMT)-like permease